MWFDKPKAEPGKNTPDGPTVAGLAVGAVRNHAVIHLDVIGVGASPYDFLVEANQDVIGVNVSEASVARDRSGRLSFYNLRSQLWWQMREALEPAANTGIALPPDPRLLADLCAPTWSLKTGKVYVESREEIETRIGRSPDWGTAAVLALMDTPKRKRTLALMAGPRSGYADYDPLSAPGMRPNQGGEYDPFRLANH